MKEKRCDWCKGNTLYKKYHDQEWGVPTFKDKILFEFLLLETFQVGLSWVTILKKRNNFKKAFDNFDYNKISRYDFKKEEKLLNDRSIIRNQSKIKASINNSKSFIKIKESKGSFSNYIWDFISGEPIVNSFQKLNEIPAYTVLSEKISTDLKHKGFRFVGPTVVYSFMQATGMVNDHLESCFRHSEVILKR
ncbi:MAG: DNA-3-methyladenine glycosylase I [Flavobacteriaceae bacterium]